MNCEDLGNTMFNVEMADAHKDVSMPVKLAMVLEKFA